jgi:DHA2 family multidrug resistance protein
MAAAPKSTSTIAASSARARHNPWLIALTVSLAAFMEVLDTSIANVALPHMAGGLSTSVDDATWVLTSYLVANAVVLPISGWFSNIFGRKRFYVACIAIFTVSSLLCGMASSIAMLILFRVIQGAVGGGLQPVSQSILADTFPRERLGMAFAVYGMAVVVAPAIGPTLGGWITDNYEWRWIFFINIPVGILSLILTSLLLQDPAYLRERMKQVRKYLSIDYIGIGLLALCLGSLQVMLDRGQEDNWFYSNLITTLAVTFAVTLALFVAWELANRHPVIDLRLLKNGNFGTANLMMFVFGLELYAATVLIPQFLQEFMGYTAELAGMALSPGALVVMVMLPFVGKLITKVQVRWVIGAGFLVSGLALFHLTTLNLQIDFKSAMMYRVYQSMGLALLFVPISTAAYAGIPMEKGGDVSGMINLFRNIGGSVGISLVETMIARRAQFHQEHLVAHITPYHQTVQNAVSSLSSALFHHGLSQPHALRQTYARIYEEVIAQATVQAYIDAAWVLGVACLAMVPMALLLKKNAPRRPEVSEI